MRTLNINAKKTDFINESRILKLSKMRIFSDFRKMCADRGPKMRKNPHKCGRMSSLLKGQNHVELLRLFTESQYSLEPHLAITDLNNVECQFSRFKLGFQLFHILIFIIRFEIRICIPTMSVHVCSSLLKMRRFGRQWRSIKSIRCFDRKHFTKNNGTD